MSIATSTNRNKTHEQYSAKRGRHKMIYIVWFLSKKFKTGQNKFMVKITVTMGAESRGHDQEIV